MASNFEFYSPTRVIFGKGTEQRVGALVREYGGTRVLIVYGGKSAVRSGVLDRAEKSLAEAGISSWTLGGVVPNPHLDKVYEGIRIGKENSIDFLLAVGGGSVIDTAKAIAYGLAEPEKDVWELYEHTRTARKCLPVASILTIAAAAAKHPTAASSPGWTPTRSGPTTTTSAARSSPSWTPSSPRPCPTIRPSPAAPTS